MSAEMQALNSAFSLKKGMLAECSSLSLLKKNQRSWCEQIYAIKTVAVTGPHAAAHSLAVTQHLDATD